MHALIVSMDPDEASILSLVLQRVGLDRTASKDLGKALENWAERPGDLIVVALDLESDPLEVMRRIRSTTEAPTVVILDGVSESRHVQLLDAGADLVVPRPYSARLLIGLTRTLMRRSRGLPVFGLPGLALGAITLDPGSRTVRVSGGPPRRLTNLEFRLLYTLMIHRDQVLPPDIIVERVWGYGGPGDRELVRGLISRLRAKVEPVPSRPQYIVTVAGVGYSFESGEG